MMLATTNDGDKFFIDGKHPCKELLNHYNAGHAKKLYIDSVTGKTMHIGYIIQNKWIQLYTITPWAREA
jgi:hypothetical protein